MAAFEYTALDNGGRQQHGVLEGDTPRQIRQQLRDRGLTPIEVSEVSERQTAHQQRSQLFQRGISSTDLAIITRQLATLVGSGLPVEEVLRVAAEQAEKAQAQRILMAVRSRVLEGHDLASALGEFPRTFSDLYRATVSAGERSGHLDIVLERLADYTEARQLLRQEVSRALVYPALVISVAILIVIGLMTYVVPQVVKVFTDTGQTLPLATRTLIACSELLARYGLWLLLVLIAGGLLLRSALRQPEFRMSFHRYLLRLPVLAKMVRGLNAARFSRTLSILNESGVPLLDALQISAQVVTNLPMKAAVEEAARRVREGTSLHRALEQAGYFPPLTVHLIASGEASGRLDEMLSRAAVSQERELQATIQTLLSFLGPLVILILGAIVLGIVMAMLLPIFELNQLVI
ncbi:MAG: type II secretion system inner membrane protein GspF [Gammaproteobacteria bacterium]|nr:type II secretion system inner membrane protein GspF [Gammaproteobacteria bacterium]